jgi:adenylate kinase
VKIILLGCPGAGKGTQAKLLSQYFHIPQVSTGDMLRASIRSGSDLGMKVKQVMDDGDLVSDDLIMALVKQRIAEDDCGGGYLFDGFPRTLGQADAMQACGIDTDCIVNIQVDDDAIVARMAGRRVHPGSGRTYHLSFNPPKREGIDDVTGEPLIQREDDSEAVVRKRLAVYHQQTKPLVAYYQAYKGGDCYREVLGEGAVNEVTQRLLAAIESLGG